MFGLPTSGRMIHPSWHPTTANDAIQSATIGARRHATPERSAEDEIARGARAGKDEYVDHHHRRVGEAHLLASPGVGRAGEDEVQHDRGEREQYRARDGHRGEHRAEHLAVAKPRAAEESSRPAERRDDQRRRDEYDRQLDGDVRRHLRRSPRGEHRPVCGGREHDY